MGWKGLPRIEKPLFQRPKHEENHAQTMVTPFNPQFSGSGETFSQTYSSN